MRSKRSMGFTLIELLVTIVMIGIATAIGINGYQKTWERERVLAASYELLGWLESARRSAIGGTSCTINISSGTKVEGSVIASMATGSSGLCASVQPLRLTALTQGYTINVIATVTPVVFTSRGTVSDGSGTGDRHISLTISPGGYSRCISINNLLGIMAVGRPDGSTCDTTRGG